MNIDNNILDQIGYLFMRYGIKSVSMDDISRKLGMSKKTLYTLVDNKTDLVRQVTVAQMEKDKRDLEGVLDLAEDPIHEMLEMARHISRQLREINPSALYDMEKYYKDIWQTFQSLHNDYIYGIIRENINHGMAEGLYRSNLNADIIARFYVGKSFILVNEDVFPASKYDREDLFQEFISYHIHGIASQRGLALLETHLGGDELK